MPASRIEAMATGSENTGWMTSGKANVGSM
jgi:hypothetical protein